MKILVINPGSTSTKVAVYNEKQEIFSSTITHTPEEIALYKQVKDQFHFRKQRICDELKRNNITYPFDVIVARGPLTKPIEGGVYAINEQMIHDVDHAMFDHPCNLGCLLANELANKQAQPCPTYIADPGLVDERNEIAKISGSPLLPRVAIAHTLNQRAIGRQYAREQQKDYESLNLIIAHLGGGISIGVHKNGRIIDVNNALNGEGPFSPERAGTLSAGSLIDLCFSGQYTQNELKQKIASQSGLLSHLGTNDIRMAYRKLLEGDKRAELILQAMAYNIAKSIGAAATVLRGDIDAILLTGGITYSDYMVDFITEHIQFLAPIKVYPGEKEMEALALNALAAQKGTLEIKTYI